MSNIRSVNLTDDQVLSASFNSKEQALDVIQKNSLTPFTFQRQEISYATINSKKVPVEIYYFGDGERLLWVLQRPVRSK